MVLMDIETAQCQKGEWLLRKGGGGGLGKAVFGGWRHEQGGLGF